MAQQCQHYLGSLSEMLSLRPHHNPLNQNLPFDKTAREFLAIAKPEGLIYRITVVAHYWVGPCRDAEGVHLANITPPTPCTVQGLEEGAQVLLLQALLLRRHTWLIPFQSSCNICPLQQNRNTNDNSTQQ